MPKIKDIHLSQIVDSRGLPGLEISIVADDQTQHTASIAISHLVYHSDSSDQSLEGAVKQSLLEAIQFVEEKLKPKIIGFDMQDQRSFDTFLLTLSQPIDKNQFTLRAQMTLSMCYAKTSSLSSKVELTSYLQKLRGTDPGPKKMPIPLFSMLEGGHATNFTIDMEEILFIPASFKTFRESVELGPVLHSAMKSVLTKENKQVLVGDKGGFILTLGTLDDILLLLTQVTDANNMRLGYDIFVGIAVRASQLYKDKKYKLKERSSNMSSDDLVKLLAENSNKYHILYLEDPMANDDITGWTNIFQSVNQNTLVTADTFIGNAPIKLQMAIEKKLASAAILKPLSFGTVTEAVAFAEMVRAGNLKIIITDSLVETNETFLADFSVAMDADYVKFGTPVKGERIAKFNRLLEIDAS